MADRSTGKPLTRFAAGVLSVIVVLGVVGLLWSTFALKPWQSIVRRDSMDGDQPQWAEVNPIGVNTFLAREVETWKRERTVEMIADMGAGWLKEHFAWSEIEPEDDVYWDAKYQQDAWAKYDQIVALAEQHGLRIIARIDQTPSWARPQAVGPGSPPVDVEKFGDFIEEFVRHYRGRVSFLQIWNEPNLASEWGGTIDPAGYVALLSEASRRARAVDPNVVILSAPMAMTTENSVRAMDELSYWQALYNLGAAEHFDIVSANAYGLDHRYDDPADPQRLNVRRVELLRDLIVANGDGDKAIWLNEFGWNTSPEEMPSDKLIWSRVSDEQQAAWTAEGIEYARERWPWFGVASIWYFRQVGDISPQRSEFYFRMVDLEFTPRNVYWSVQTVGIDQRVARPGSYGPLEAPLIPFGSWPVAHDTESSDLQISGVAGDSFAVRVDGDELTLELSPELSHGPLQVEVFAGADPVGSSSSSEVQLTPGQADVRIDVGSPTQSQGVKAVRVSVGEGALLTLEGIHVSYERSYRNVAIAGFVLVLALGGRLMLRRWANA